VGPGDDSRDLCSRWVGPGNQSAHRRHLVLFWKVAASAAALLRLSLANSTVGHNEQDFLLTEHGEERPKLLWQICHVAELWQMYSIPFTYLQRGVSGVGVAWQPGGHSGAILNDRYTLPCGSVVADVQHPQPWPCKAQLPAVVAVSQHSCVTLHSKLLTEWQSQHPGPIAGFRTGLLLSQPTYVLLSQPHMSTTSPPPNKVGYSVNACCT
jgi:hypothetical protein